jgi:hypothetical protein
MRTIRVVVTAAFLVFVASCANARDNGGPSGSSAVTSNSITSSTSSTPPIVTTTTADPRPGGPAADLSEEITGGNGVFIGAAVGLEVPTGYVQHEYVAAGTATAYKPSSPITNDGRWNFEPDTTAPYRTRVLIRRPADLTAFSGTVIVEFLNVSGGLDANPDYSNLEAEITRSGDAWVGVSAQRIGVEGGPVLVRTPGYDNILGKGLKGVDPARYGSLVHPGDGYAFDIFTQVARAIREGGIPLGGATPKFVLAAGQSQAAFALTTYYDGVQPLTHEFDGFFIHSRAAVGLSLAAPGKSADIAGSLGNPVTPIFRTDLSAPVLDVQSETDVTILLKSALVRQPDSDRFRLWEIAGTSHADAYVIGRVASTLNCGGPINNGPMNVVAKAALHHLKEWVEAGILPPVAPRLELTTAATTALLLDADGIAVGGIRTPPLDVPVDVLSGKSNGSTDLICILLGASTPLAPARLAELYASRAVYEQKYASATDAAIEAGFVLEADRQALLAFAQPDRIAG